MLHNIKSRVFRFVGRNIEECRDAFEDGLAQGKILRQKYKEAKEEIKAQEEAKQEPEVVYETRRDMYEDNPVEPTTSSI